MTMARKLKGFGWARKKQSALSRDERGTAAIEFGLLAPILVLACLATVDVGLAIGERMEIDHTLRASSIGAMGDIGEEEVRDLVEAVASESFTIRSEDPDAIGTSTEHLAVAVERFCACPESVSAQVNCTSGTCANSAKPYLYYRLSAEKDYSPMLLPTIPLRGSVLVQVK